MRVYEEIFADQHDLCNIKAELYVLFTKSGKSIRLESMNAGQMIFELVSCYYAFLKNNMLFGYDNTTKNGCVRINDKNYALKEIIALYNGDQRGEIGLCMNKFQNMIPEFLYKNMGAKKILPSDIHTEYMMYTAFPEKIDNATAILSKLKELLPNEIGKTIPRIVAIETSQPILRALKKMILFPSSGQCDYFFTHAENDSMKIVHIFDLFVQFLDMIKLIHSKNIIHGDICAQNMMVTHVSIHEYSPTKTRQAILFGWEKAKEYDENDPELIAQKVADLTAFGKVFDTYMQTQKQYIYKEKIQTWIRELDYESIKTIIQYIHGKQTCIFFSCVHAILFEGQVRQMFL
jgi:hypothetical protein